MCRMTENLGNVSRNKDVEMDKWKTNLSTINQCLLVALKVTVVEGRKQKDMAEEGVTMTRSWGIGTCELLLFMSYRTP